MKESKITQAAEVSFLLEYGKRRIDICADTFQNLAQIFEGKDTEEADIEKEQEREEFLFRHQMSEGRLLLAANLREMADMIKEVAKERVQFITLGKRRQKQVVRELAGEGIVAGDIYLVRRQDERMELAVSLQYRGKSSKTTAEAADYLSVLLDMRLVSSRRNPFFIAAQTGSFYFEEEPSYCVLTGMARAVKETETVSGDNHAFFEAQDGNMTILLSDGMGSGEKACRDSAMITDIAQDMLEAGVPMEMTYQLINSAAASSGTGENMSTLDLCSVDLYEGSCQFLKAGAASSFIKRGQMVEKIPCMTLPLGVLASNGDKAAEYPLMDGDYIIILSDGMMQGWPDGDGEFLIHNLLSRLDAISPGEIANLLMKYAIEQCKGKIRDDMTVLTAGIWETHRS